MNSYVVVLNCIDNKRGNDKYETIKGNSLSDAVRKRFGKNVKRVYGNDKIYTNLIIRTGWYDNDSNAIRLNGRICKEYCFRKER